MKGTRQWQPTKAANSTPGRQRALLEQTRRQAQREFDLRPPLLSVIRAVVILVGYGAVWWSVRGQHPYKGPTAAGLVEIYTAVIVVVVMTASVFKRATSGVGGQSRRQQKAYGVAFGTAWIAVSVFQGALKHDGASHAIVYGVFPAAGPLLVIGAAVAAMAAAREGPCYVRTSLVIS